LSYIGGLNKIAMKTSATKFPQFFFYFLLMTTCAFAQPATGPDGLVVPILLEKEKRIAGNPLATYAAMLAKEQQYLQSKVLSRVYREMRFNYEEFLGVPNAGADAMSFMMRKRTSNNDTVIDAAFKPVSALDAIKQEAAKTQIVIWGEEHHLPQTRSLFEGMLQELWKLGYRYLAAETFDEGLRDSSIKYVDYKTGLYTHDPVYASAVNLALALGYKLIDYDNKEYSETEPSLRDIRQAEYIRDRVLAKDKNAKLLIIAGRGHASEQMAADGWKPMAFNLKQLTGIDPFTVYAPAMTERNTREEEDPLYRYAAANNMLKEPVLLRNASTKEYISSSSFDAYVFFPRVNIVQGRPDWLFSTMQRTAVPLSDKLCKGDSLRLVQAFAQGQPVNTIPADQFLLTANESKSLALKKGKYYVRVIDASGKVLAEENIFVGN
jgi:hypothetical protein